MVVAISCLRYIPNSSMRKRQLGRHAISLSIAALLVTFSDPNIFKSWALSNNFITSRGNCFPDPVGASTARKRLLLVFSSVLYFLPMSVPVKQSDAASAMIGCLYLECLTKNSVNWPTKPGGLKKAVERDTALEDLATGLRWVIAGGLSSTL